MKYYLNKDVETIIKFTKNLKKQFEGKNILITGGNGFLGKYFIEYFKRLNKEIQKPINLTVYDISFIKNKYEKNIKLIKKDVSKPFRSNKKYNIIIHAAGIASPFYYRKSPIETVKVTIEGVKNCLELAKSNNAKLIYFSSSEIYGDPHKDYVPTNENYNGNVSSMGPRACYDESKRLGETLCWIYSNYHKVHTNIIRPFNIYGPGMKQNDYRIFPNFASNSLNNKKLNVYGKGNQTRTYCYISDAIEGFLKVIAKGKSGEAYNIGNDKPEISIIEVLKIFKKMEKKLNYKKINYPKAYPADEPQRRCPDLSKARKQLNYNPKIKIDDGLKLFYDWAKENYKY